MLPAIRGARLEAFLDIDQEEPAKEIIVKQGDTSSKQENPDYGVWVARDQQVLSFLVGSLSPEILPHVVGAKTAAALWDIITELFAARSRANTTNLRIALATAEKGTRSMAEYVAKMKTLENEMASAGKPLDDEDMVSYILAGLKDPAYDGLIAAIVSRTDPISVSELYSQLESYESRQHMLCGSSSSQSSVNAAQRGGRGRFGRGGGRGPQGRGNNGGGGYGNGGYGNAGFNNNGPNNSNGGRGNYNTNGRGNFNNNGRGRGNGGNGGQRPRCQVCNVTGHVAMDCWYRFDQDFVPRERSANAANYNNNGGQYNNYGGNGNGWVVDTGATDHVTSELEKLHIHEQYHGNDQVHTANGAGLGHEEGSA